MQPGSGAPACQRCQREATVTYDCAENIWRARIIHATSCPASGGYGDVLTALFDEECRRDLL